MLGVLGTLAFVLVLLGIALKLLRRFAPATTSGRGARFPLEVVQRLALGPKQGIALVRIGDRMVAVSVGDGGIRRLLDVEDVTQPEAASSQRPATSAAASGGIDFRAAMRSALKTAGLAVLVGVALPALPYRSASAQGVAAKPPSSAQLSSIANAAVSGVRGGASPADLVTKLVAGGSTRGSSSAPRSAPSAAVPQLDLRLGGSGDGLRLRGTVGVVVTMGLLTLLPTLLLMMTGFTRILIVLNFLRQAIGAQSAPPAQLVAGLALLLTGFVMAPTLAEVNRTALKPWLDGQIDQAQMLDIGARPFRSFMLRQTRPQDIQTFVHMTAAPTPATIQDVPLVTLTSAFVISELRTAFQIGFALFLPFIVIDIAVSSVLMSMGMFMLPPAMIALPFKLLLFVLVDGWSLVIQSLVTSFR